MRTEGLMLINGLFVYKLSHLNICMPSLCNFHELINLPSIINQRPREIGFIIRLQRNSDWGPRIMLTLMLDAHHVHHTVIQRKITYTGWCCCCCLKKRVFHFLQSVPSPRACTILRLNPEHIKRTLITYLQTAFCTGSEKVEWWMENVKKHSSERLFSQGGCEGLSKCLAVHDG